MSWLLRVRDLKSKLRILIWNPHLHVCKFSVHTCVFSYLNHNSKFINFSAAELRGFWFSQQSAFFKMDGSLGTWDLYVAFGMFSWCFLLLHELADNGRCELQTIWTFSMVSLNHCSFFPGFHRGLWLSLIVPHPLTWWEVLQREMFVPPVMRCASLPSPEQTPHTFNLLPSVSVSGLGGCAQQGAVQFYCSTMARAAQGGQNRTCGTELRTSQNAPSGVASRDTEGTVLWPFPGVWWATWDFVQRTSCGLTG